MRRQRPSTRGQAIDAVAEDLPFPDDSFDAGMATITIHQWRDLARGLAELQRVTRGPIVIMTFDPDVLRRFWLAKYAPRLMDHEAGRMPAISRVEHLLGGSNECVSLPIPENCSDGFAEAYFGRPEAFFDDAVRGAQSAWSFLEADEITSALHALRADLDSGAWDRSYGHLREAPEYDGALRLIIHRRTSPRR
jgi:SAM-dependent methyltransferase